MRKIILFVLFFTVIMARSQTFTVIHEIFWQTQNQNMWGPNGNPIQLDFDYEIFHFDWDTTVSAGHIANFFGAQFGAMFNIYSQLEMGSHFGIHGFNTGSVDVSYPVRIYLEFPDSGTIIPGQYSTVESSYEVLPGWDLTTHFPTAGVAGLYLDFGTILNVNATICIVNCWNTNLINLNVPYDTIPIFEINTISGTITYPCIQNFLPAICTDTILPLVITNIGGIGLDLIATLPYVETTDWLGQDKCLYASGDDWYLTLQLNIVQFLSFIAGLIPPPTGPAIQAFLQMLNGTINIGGGFSITYNLLSAWLKMNNYLQQDFTFCPKIWSEFTYPLDVYYYVTDPNNGNITIENGYNDTIIWMVTHNLHFLYPCNGYDSVTIGIRHFMTNDFTNHTWDSIAFDFTIQAFHFIINFPIYYLHSVELPPICMPGDQIHRHNQFDIDPDTNQILCISSLTTPSIGPELEDLQIVIGPLFNYTIPLGYFDITWFHETWELAGFHDSIFPPVTLYPGPTLDVEILGSNVICFGESTGVIIAHAINGVPPYTFYWSTGETNVQNTPYDTIIVPSGTYYVTVSDGGDCMATTQISIYDNPEILITLIPEHVHCKGDSTGSILSIVTGGTPPYTFLWEPGNYTTQNIHNIPSGLYTLIVTDSVGCKQTATVFVDELYPKPNVWPEMYPTAGCQALTVHYTELFNEPNCTYLWQFGDGKTSTNQTGIHIYKFPGTYDVTLIVTNEWNCSTIVTLSQHITVYPRPLASFYAVPEIVYASENPSYLVQFYNTSQGGTSYIWNFNDPGSNSITTVENPSHQFSSDGEYEVILIAGNEYNCMDTAKHIILVIDDILLFPNVITPNGDGYNDYFVIENIHTWEHHITIYNRWGKVVYESNNYQNDWDGQNLSTGTYYYIVRYWRNNVQKEYHGSLTIIK